MLIGPQWLLPLLIKMQSVAAIPPKKQCGTAEDKQPCGAVSFSSAFILCWMMR
jgi:hypothetical protein